MAYFIIYIIKSTLCLTLFYFLYKALLSRETFFRFNRIVLLTGMAVCAVLPLVEYKTQHTTTVQESMIRVENFFHEEIAVNQSANFSTEAATDNKTTDAVVTAPVSKQKFSIDMIEYSVWLYISGLLIMVTTLAISLIKVRSIIRKGRKRKEGDNTIVVTTEKISPFSWSKYIVLNEADYDNHIEEILAHEKAHIQMKHSFDLVFSELFMLFHWFNPVAWLLKKELQNIHEYEADMGVINQGIDATKYQLLLVKKAAGARSYAIANSFNHSKLKKRITMMLKRKSTHWARLRILAFAPLAAVVLHAFARPEIDRWQESLDKGEITTNAQQEKQWTKEFFDGEFEKYKGQRITSVSTDKNAFVTIYSTQVRSFAIGKDGDFVFVENSTTKDSKGETVYIAKMTKISLDDAAKKIEAMLQKVNSSSVKRPHPIVCIDDVQPSAASADKLQEFLNMAGNLYDKRRKEIKAQSPGLNLDEKLPFLVLINGKDKNIKVNDASDFQPPIPAKGTPPPPPPIKKTTTKSAPPPPIIVEDDQLVLKETKKRTPPKKMIIVEDDQPANKPVLKETKVTK